MYTGFAWDLAVRRAEVLEIFKIPKP